MPILNISLISINFFFKRYKEEYSTSNRLIYYIRLFTWILVIGTCIVFMVEQVAVSTIKLLHPPVSTQTRMVINDSLIYPAITLCYRNELGNSFQPSVLKEMGVNKYWKTENDEYIDQTWMDFHWDNTSLSDLWANATYTMQPLFEPLAKSNITRTKKYKQSEHPNFDQFKQEQSTPSSNDKNDSFNTFKEKISLTVATLNGRTDILTFNYTFFYEYGRCYTFRPNGNVTMPPGSHYGYKFQFYKYAPPGNPKNTPKKVYNGGWEIYVHNAGEYWSENEPLSDSQHEHFFVDMGYRVEIKLSQFAYFTMNRRGDPCNSDSSYSRTRCKERCRWQHLMAATNITCSLPFAFPINTAQLEVPQCKTFKEAIHLMTRYRQWLDYTKECNLECLRKCDGRIFEGKVIREFESDDNMMTSISLHFPSGLYTFLKEEEGYDQSMFLADLGGSLGFMLGISVITVLELYDWMLLKACAKCSRFKANIHEKIREQKQQRVMKKLRRNLTIPDIILDKVRTERTDEGDEANL